VNGTLLSRVANIAQWRLTAQLARSKQRVTTTRHLGTLSKKTKHVSPKRAITSQSSPIKPMQANSNQSLATRKPNIKLPNMPKPRSTEQSPTRPSRAQQSRVQHAQAALNRAESKSIQFHQFLLAQHRPRRALDSLPQPPCSRALQSVHAIAKQATAAVHSRSIKANQRNF
jgi:hypothetical protein